MLRFLLKKHCSIHADIQMALLHVPSMKALHTQNQILVLPELLVVFNGSLKKGDAACTLYKSLYSEANWSHILGHIISLLDDIAMYYVGLCLFSLTIVRIVSNHKDIGLLESPLKIQTSEP